MSFTQFLFNIKNCVFYPDFYPIPMGVQQTGFNTSYTWIEI